MSKIIKIAKSLHTTCPRCGTQIEYKHNDLNHQGDLRCLLCGHSFTPIVGENAQAKYTVEEDECGVKIINVEDSSFAGKSSAEISAIIQANDIHYWDFLFNKQPIDADFRTFDDIGALKEFAASKYAYPYQKVAGPENTDGKRHIYLFQTVGKNATIIQL